VPIGAVHRLANPGKIPLELIEAQVEVQRCSIDGMAE
jgi:mannose-6-phosphate isomerase-like protein (cupin superfamily)